MELILNLVWLMLFIPAAVVCLRAPERDHRARFSGRLGAFVVMGSILVIAFPLISATDDLMALRVVMEESGSSDRVAKSSSPDSSDSNDLFNIHFLPGRTPRIGLSPESWAELSPVSTPSADSVVSEALPPRAPPTES